MLPTNISPDTMDINLIALINGTHAKLCFLTFLHSFFLKKNVRTSLQSQPIDSQSFFNLLPIIVQNLSFANTFKMKKNLLVGCYGTNLPLHLNVQREGRGIMRLKSVYWPRGKWVRCPSRGYSLTSQNKVVVDTKVWMRQASQGRKRSRQCNKQRTCN